MRTAITMEPLTPVLRERMEEAYRSCGHRAVLATHAFIQGGEIIGGAGLFAPCITFWAHPKLQPRDSFELVRRTIPNTEHLLVCENESPFFPYIPRFGYIPAAKPATAFFHSGVKA